MKNKKNRVNITGKLLYLVVAVLVLMIIPSAAENAYDYFREKQSRKGYTSEKLRPIPLTAHEKKLYEDFCDGDYGRLSEKVAYNRAVGRTVTEDDRDYYAFSACYNSAVDYHMYRTAGKTDKASDTLEIFYQNESELNHLIFKDALTAVKEVYEIP
jgi:hypothetical protein